MQWLVGKQLCCLHACQWNPKERGLKYGRGEKKYTEFKKAHICKCRRVRKYRDYKNKKTIQERMFIKNTVNARKEIYECHTI